ncbi:hypothetical protein OI70_16365 [Dickeya fangzhongdai]|nr:hypothetical protein LH89_14835 [Dickeya fangzhongdai]KGT97311.1 hypothetical protein NM75_15745 [Dickeya fangzhongdai]KHN54329.1 hypothetical protein OI70_16365 [Dickeya fangzhongdai]
MAIFAFPRDRLVIQRELTGRITFAGVKRLAITRFTLKQSAFMALGTCQGRFIRAIDGFRMLAFRIVTATDEHPITPLT